MGGLSFGKRTKRSKSSPAWFANRLIKPSGTRPTRKKRRSAPVKQVAPVLTAETSASLPATLPPITAAVVESPPVVFAPTPIPPPLNQAYGPAPLSTENLVRPDDTLRRSIEAFLLDQRSEHTRRAYGKDLKRFVQFLLHRKLQKGVESIERATLVAYKDSLLSEGLEHTTIDRHLATLRSFFRWLVDDGIIGRNPAESVRFLNPKRQSRTAGFTDDEVRAILRAPDPYTRTGNLHRAILSTLFYCGLRRSELCSLRTSQLSLERGHRVLRLRGKGNAERIVVVTPPAWRAIEQYLKAVRKTLTQDQPLFTPIKNNRTKETAKPLDPSMIYYLVVRYARMAGIANRVSPHSCRATAISNARDHNASDRAIQEFAGWASPDMITRYDKRKSAIEKSAAHAIQYGGEAAAGVAIGPEPASDGGSNPEAESAYRPDPPSSTH